MIDGIHTQALVTNIEYLSSHDGPGVRTTVFMKGCSLRCQWCHNPETIHSYQELQWNDRLCIACLSCYAHCRSGAIRGGKVPFVDSQKCVRCFDCTGSCPSGALSVVGKRYSVDELELQLVREETLLKAMKGGVTFSGGEPALQAKFVVGLAERLKNRGIHLALDTCGYAPWTNYEMLLPYMDLILYDIKEMDAQKHIAFTGHDNQLIHDNLIKMCRYIQANALPVRIWIRTPLIPDYTATGDNVKAIGRFLSEIPEVIERWELCTFNNLCRDKYRRLGLSWVLKGLPLMRKSENLKLKQLAQDSVLGRIMVTTSGLMA